MTLIPEENSLSALWWPILTLRPRYLAYHHGSSVQVGKKTEEQNPHISSRCYSAHYGFNLRFSPLVADMGTTWDPMVQLASLDPKAGALGK